MMCGGIMNMNFKNRDLLAIEQLSKEEISHVFSLAKKLQKGLKERPLEGLLLGSCFFEPSTRTRLSFESAMYRLGGSVIGFSEDKATSVAKGESLEDSMRVIASYVDAIVLRHPSEGSAQFVADLVDVPVINAGDGSNEHPTQTLLDLFAIQETQGRLEDLHIAMVGDLRHARTIHSLVKASLLFPNRLYFVAPPFLELPKELIHQLRKRGLQFSFHDSLQDILPKLDIIYLTRIQKERFDGSVDYEKVKDAYTLRKKDIAGAKDTMKILHPLPRVGELGRCVDETSHAHYFEQAKSGLLIRQALLSLIFGRVPC